MYLKNLKVIIAILVTSLIQISGVSAFDLSEVTNVVNQVNAVANTLNVPQPIPTSPDQKLVAPATNSQQLEKDQQSKELTTNISSESISNFKAVWCKDVDLSTKGKYAYKELSSGDLCLAPEIVISNILKIESGLRDGQSLIDTFGRLTDPLSFDLSNYALEQMSNKDYLFRSVKLLVYPDIKKIYIALFVVGVCPQDATNSLNEGNSFRKSLETKYGNIDGSLSEYDVQNQQMNQLKSAQQTQSNQAITVLEAKKAREYGNGLNMISKVTSNIPKDMINSVFWNQDGQQVFLVSTKSSEGFGTRLKDCESTNYFHFIYGTSPKLVEFIGKQTKLEADAKKKHEETAAVPKF